MSFVSRRGVNFLSLKAEERSYKRVEVKGEAMMIQASDESEGFFVSKVLEQVGTESKVNPKKDGWPQFLSDFFCFCSDNGKRIFMERLQGMLNHASPVDIDFAGINGRRCENVEGNLHSCVRRDQTSNVAPLSMSQDLGKGRRIGREERSAFVIRVECDPVKWFRPVENQSFVSDDVDLDASSGTGPQAKGLEDSVGEVGVRCEQESGVKKLARTYNVRERQRGE